MSYTNDLLSDTPVMGVPVSDKKPLYTETETKDAGNDRFVVRGWQDIWAGVFVVLLVIAMITLAGITVHRTNIFQLHILLHYSIFKLLLWVAIIGFIAFVTALLFFVLMYFTSRYYIIFANLICIVGSYGAAGFFFYILPWRQAILISIPLIIGATVHLVWFCCAWSRIPFTACLLKASVKVVFQFPGILLVSFGVFVATIVHTFVSIMLLVGIFVHFVDDMQHLFEHGICLSGKLSIVALVLYWYWMAQIIRNIVFVTVSGVAATKYFLSTSIPSFVTAKSLGRALTTSFGSICFGSLLVAIIQTIHRICRYYLDEWKVAGCIVDCLIGMLERLLVYFNNYAFTYVALYGESFVESAKKAWKLISHSSFATFFNDSLISYTMIFTSLFIVVAINVCAYYITESWIVVIVSFFWTGYVTSTTFRTISICVTTLYVCVSEEPKPLEKIEPELYQKMCKDEPVRDISMSPISMGIMT